MLEIANHEPLPKDDGGGFSPALTVSFSIKSSSVMLELGTIFTVELNGASLIGCMHHA